MQSDQTIRKFEHRGLQDRESMAAILESLAAAIRGGRILLKHSDSELVLEPGEGLDVHLNAERMNEHSRMRIDISWESMDSFREDRLEIHKG